MQPGSFAVLMAELRDRLGYSQERMAAALHVSFGTINRWEKGKSEPDPAVRESVKSYIRGLGPEFEDLCDWFPGGTYGGPPGAAESGSARSVRKRLAVRSRLLEYESQLAQLSVSVRALIEALSETNKMFLDRYADQFRTECQKDRRSAMWSPGLDEDRRIPELTVSVSAITQAVSALDDRFPAQYDKFKAAASEAADVAQRRRK